LEHLYNKDAVVLDLGHEESAHVGTCVNVTPTELYRVPIVNPLTIVAHPSNSILPVILYTSPITVGILGPPNLNIFEPFVQS
jgi:hypothetical protein